MLVIRVAVRDATRPFLDDEALPTGEDVEVEQIEGATALVRLNRRNACSP